MKRPTIAVDIDDVLAANAESFVAWSNQKWGTNLTVDDYDEHWGEVWGVDIEENRRRATQYHQEHTMRDYRHYAEAKPVLAELGRRYRLVIVTSRPKIGQQDTIEWIERYFPEVFDGLYFAGMWDKVTEDSILQTKAELCREVGADYLIDDQPKHCLAAADIGVQAVLFGNYAWNQLDPLPANVTRCSDWASVDDYFGLRSRDGTR